MSGFIEFDSWEDMAAAMASAENDANEGLLPSQIELRDDTTHIRYWARAYPQMGIIIFGETPPPHPTDGSVDLRRRGYLSGMCYSQVENEGEWGDTHVSQVAPISKAAFEEAKAHDWQAVTTDTLGELMIPPEVLAEKTTPTLVKELFAFDAELRASRG